MKAARCRKHRKRCGVEAVSQLFGKFVRQRVGEFRGHFPFDEFAMVFFHHVGQIKRGCSRVEQDESCRQTHQEQESKTAQCDGLPTREEP